MPYTQLTRARVVTDSTGKEESITTVARVSQTAWLREVSHPTIAAIKSRIEAVTSLSADTEQQHCEQYQVANYGIGGHYVPHYDYIFKDIPEPEREQQLTEENKNNGDRIATFMIYVSIYCQNTNNKLIIIFLFLSNSSPMFFLVVRPCFLT